ncbi:MAG: hypothetical protein OEV95_02435 [Gemmatimonadota bacterium]|nr:hypothetical protein [Gemmatimonadota bacterium]MDH5283562.1 hypothetical protein [Gemmatimonadota bacterium]
MRTRRRVFRLIVLALVLPATKGQAQGPVHDSLLDLTSLASLADLAELRAAADSIDHPHGGRASWREWTAAGLAYLAVANRTTSYRDYRTALDRLERAVVKDSRSAPAWYAIGLARLAMADRGFTAKPGPEMVIGDSYADGAARAFLKALELDSGYLPAATAMAGLVGTHDLRVKRARLLAALEKATSSPGGETADVVVARAWLMAGQGDTAEAMRQLSAFQRDPPDSVTRATPSGAALTPVLFAQSQLELRSGLADTALYTLARFLRAGGDSALARHEQARALFALGRPGIADSIYYLGAREVRHSLGRGWYRHQIHWVVHPGELNQFDALPLDQLEPWLRTFWGRRDAEDGRPAGSRLEEHFRRWDYALAHYAPERRFNPRGAGWSYLSPTTQAIADQLRDAAATEKSALERLGQPQNEADGQAPAWTPFQYPFREQGSDDPTLDDRGAIYMRLGNPDARANYPGIEQVYAASWRYVAADGSDLVFHFKDVPFDGVIAPTTLSVFPAGDLEEACKVDHRVCRLAREYAAGRGSPPERAQALIEGSRANVHSAFRSDGFPPRHASSLEAVVQLYGLPATPTTGGRVLAVFTVPRTALGAGETAGGRAAYRMGIRLSAIGADGLLYQLDTIRTFVADTTSAEGQLLGNFMELPVPEGTYLATLALTANHDSAGSLSRLPDLSVPRLDGDSLDLAGLLLGRQESALRVSHAGEEIRLNPGNAYRPDDPAEVYFFVAGMVRGREYQTTIELRRKQKLVLTTRFAEHGEAGIRLVRRSLDLSRLAPGWYLLAVRVEDPITGAQASQEQRLNVVK